MLRGVTCLLTMVAVAQDPTPTLSLFARARTNMVQNLKTQPNYVCLETIERSQKSSAKKRSTLLDVLRFEVAFVGSGELYAWPGSNRFDEKTLWEMVPPGGTIGTGSFAAHAYNLFVAGGPRFLPGVWTEIEGKQMAKYPFDVAEMVSAYRIRSNSDAWVAVPYRGFVLVDPAINQVVRMDIVADEIPIQLELAEAHTIIDFGNVKIGDNEYRLPTGAVDVLTRFTGLEQRNDSRFTGCRSYQTQSKLSFGDPPPDEAPVKAASKEVLLPPNADFYIDLVTRVDSATSQTGDLVEARLATPIKRNHEIVFDKKSVVEGRIVRLQRHTDWAEAEIQFTTIADGEKSAPFTAVPLSENQPLSVSSAGPAGKPIFKPVPNRKGAGSILVRGDQLILLKGMRSGWTTRTK